MVSKWGSGDGVIVDGEHRFVNGVLIDGRYGFRNEDGSVFFREESELSEYWTGPGAEFRQGDIVIYDDIKYEVLSYQPDKCRLYRLESLFGVTERVTYINTRALELWLSQEDKIIRELDSRGIVGKERELVLDVCANAGLKDWDRK